MLSYPSAIAFLKGLFLTPRNSKKSKAGRERRDSRDSVLSDEGPETRPHKMTLEERMAFRKELLQEIIRTTLTSRFIPSSTYRYKVMRRDERGHSFVVMLDMSPTFLASPAGDDTSLNETAALLIKNARTKYGLQVSGVYWRPDERLDVANANRAAAAAAAAVSAAPMVASAANKPEAVTADEMAAFEAAWQTDSEFAIGERTYSTEFAPMSGPGEESKF